jgi:hypothetical protein
MISTQEHLVVYEDNLWIRTGECGLAVVGVVYALYLLAVFILKSKR